MRHRLFVRIFALLTGVIAVGAVLLTVRAAGQTPPAERPREVRPPFAAPPGPVLTGSDIGVRLRGDADTRKGTVPGNLVVKINGQWIDVVAPFGGVVVPAAQ